MNGLHFIWTIFVSPTFIEASLFILSYPRKLETVEKWNSQLFVKSVIVKVLMQSFSLAQFY